MLTGLLATAMLAPGQAPPPVAAAPPATIAAAPSIDPRPSELAPAADGGFSYDTTHQGPAYSFWGGADYRMYWFKDGQSPGVLGTVNGLPVGNTATDFGSVSGIGFNSGGWLNCRHTFGLEAGGFLFQQKDATTVLATGGDVVRPFTNALTGQPGSFLVSNAATPGSLTTAQGVRLSGFEVNAISNLAHCCDWSADFLVGLRYVDLDEYLSVSQTSTLPAGTLTQFAGVPVAGGGGTLSLQDRFRTRNQFYGGQVGLRGEYKAGGGFFVGLSSKVGIGNNHQRVDIDGRSDFAGLSAPGGLLATQGTANTASNIGTVTTNRFAVLVDLGLSAGYQFAPWGRAKVGYDFLYLSDVARPGEQVDRVINPRLVPASTAFGGVAGVASPVMTGRNTDFLAHGVRFGLELMY